MHSHAHHPKLRPPICDPDPEHKGKTRLRSFFRSRASRAPTIAAKRCGGASQPATEIHFERATDRVVFASAPIHVALAFPLVDDHARER